MFHIGMISLIDMLFMSFQTNYSYNQIIQYVLESGVYRFSDQYYEIISWAKECQTPCRCYPCHKRWYRSKITQYNTQ